MNPSHINSPGRTYAFKFLYRLSLKDFAELKENLKNDSDGLSIAIREFENSYQEEDKEHPNNLLNDGMRTFAKNLICGVLKDEDALREKISPLLQKRSLDSLEKVNYTILMLGSYELLTPEEAPRNVILDEYINLAKEFGSNDSSRFINGVLDKIV